ncbi:hypothetical protein QQ045_006877 [Rhodiola kirilowii]
MERVEHAARVANADEFIRILPVQYNTSIGPRGSRLSGGQKQRNISALDSQSELLVRQALLRLMKDRTEREVVDIRHLNTGQSNTSALDSQSELLARQALLRLMKIRTVLVIAHKLETVMTADRIFLLVDGKLKEIPASSLVSDNHESFIASGIVELTGQFPLFFFFTKQISETLARNFQHREMDTSNPAAFVNGGLTEDVYWQKGQDGDSGYTL